MAKKTIPISQPRVDRNPYRQYLVPSRYVEITPTLRRLVREYVVKNSASPQEAVAEIFDYVRDLPFGVSKVYKTTEAWDHVPRPLIGISKATLQVGLCRSVGVATRFHTWKLTPLRELMKRANEFLSSKEMPPLQGELIFYHSSAEVYLRGKWVIVDATIDRALEPVFEANVWAGVKDMSIKGFHILQDLGLAADVPDVAVNYLDRGGRLPIYLRPFNSMVLSAHSRRINGILDAIRDNHIKERSRDT